MTAPLRRRFLAVALLLAGGALCVPSADAAPVSYNNPFRSFNISGINYGSMQWERQHRQGSSSSRHYVRTRRARWR